ncbi:GAP family protein [Nocardia goodfellowii]|uniref:Threonine/homoserine/homoserine lactone efflux protein n=1 Tax=Nocardia goodfellowii TaxID=882446 RepID=A0ABS4QKI7_9NOCA|nr:GAP family protein [Nocardia goodfellowii]MBP2191603.1 threonine/homoserine/homoserine lactone efflux protein [Nocardia goodfellowii]
MGSVLGDLLPLAVGVAISPIPIVAAILMILSRNAAGSGTGFALGWVCGIAVVTIVFVALSGMLGGSGDRQASTAGSWIKVGLGVALLALAAAQWRRRSDTDPPGWMRAIDSFTTIKAAGLGVLLSAVNPKNMLLCVSAGVTIGSSDLATGEKAVAVAVFTVLAAASVLMVVLSYAVAADRLRESLDRTRQWLQANNHAVMAIVLLVMGAAVIGKGIGGL